MESTKPLTEEERRKCTVCDSKLHGRSDKVFCSVKCKNKAYAQHRKDANSAGAADVKKMQRNYYILSYLTGKHSDKFQVSTRELRRLGFHFDVISGIESNKYACLSGRQGFKFRLFEFSWYQVNNQCIQVYRNPGEQEISPYVYNRWERHLKHKENPLA